MLEFLKISLVVSLVILDSTLGVFPAYAPNSEASTEYRIMAKQTNLEYCILNIAANPHPSGVYFDLFKQISGERVNFWGESFATVSAPREVENGFFQGRVVLWTEIDETQPAILKNKLEEIDLKDLDFPIPENVGFNGKIFLYTFREKDHTLFIESKNEFNKSLSANRAHRIISKLLSPEVLGVDAPLVEVTVVPEEDALKRIMAIPYLKRLEIHILKPNADDKDADEVLAELEEQGARKQEIVLVASPKSDGINPNERTQKQTEVAQYNGHVNGRGKEEDGTPVRYSTKEYPRTVRNFIDEFGSSVQSALSTAKNTIIGSSDN